MFELRLTDQQAMRENVRRTLLIPGTLRTLQSSTANNEWMK